MASYTIPRSRTSSWVVIQRNQNSQGKNNWTLLLIFLLSLIIIIIIVIIVHLFANHLLRRRRRRAVAASTLHANNAHPVSSTTLDARAIALFPTYAYHSGGSNEGGESQCMVCLSAAKEGEVMRLLPHCKHFFHVSCIDMWLHSHPTCPICRADVNRWRGKSNGQMLASPMMAARVGGARTEELSISKEMVEEVCSTLKIGSSFCIRMSMERRQGQADDVVVDLERQ